MNSLPNNSKLVKIGEAARILGVSIDTLRRWEKSGRIETVRTPGGTRLYPIRSLKNFAGGSNTPVISTPIAPVRPVVEPEIKNPLERSVNLKTYSTQELLEAVEKSPALKDFSALPVQEFIAPIEIDISKSFKIHPNISLFEKSVLGIISLCLILVSGLVSSMIMTNQKSISPPIPRNEQKVLAASTAAGFLLINADLKIDGSVSGTDFNGLTLLANDNGFSISGGATEGSLTVTSNSAEINQNVSNTASPSFVALNVTGNKINGFTIPSGTTTFVGTDLSQTLTNKTLSGGSNTLTNIANASLTNSKVTITAGDNLTGGGDVSLGSSITISLKSSPSVSGQVLLADGTASAPGLAFSSDTNTGLYRIGTDKIALITGGTSTQGITIDSSGNVGLNNASPSYKLDVSGTLNASGATTLASTLGVTGATTLSSTLAVTSDTTLTGDLAINGGDLTTTASSFNLLADTTTINLGGGTGANTINIGTGGTTADTITIGNNASSTSLALTSGTGSQTFTSSVATGTTTTSAFVFADNALTTGTGLNLSSTSLTSGKLARIAPTFAGSAATGYGLYVDGADSTANANTDYAQYNVLALTGNAAKTGTGLYSTVTSTSTTADTIYAADFLADHNGAIGIGTKTVYGLRAQATSDTPTDTGGVINTYAGYFSATGAAGGTHTAYGIYATATGGDTNWAGYFAGNVTLSTGSDILAQGAGTDLGSSSVRFATGYFDNIDATSIAGVLSSGSTNNAAWTINADNATADTEDASLVFERGTTTPNSVIGWDSTNDEIDINSSVHITGTTSLATTPLFLIETGSNQTTGDIADITATYAPTAGGTQSGIDINLTNAPTTSANTLRGIDLAITDATALANTIYGTYSTVDNSTNTATGTHSIYGGYFTATGKSAGTTTGVGLYASASGADNNYAAVFESGNVGVGVTTPTATLHVVGQCVTGDTKLKRRRRRKSTSDGGQDEGEDSSEVEWEDIRIDQIKSGDEILTLDEKTGQFVPQKVKALMDMGKQEVRKLITRSGKTIETTGNHPYLVKMKAGQPDTLPLGGTYEIDQSPKLEDMTKDSFIAIANEQSKYVLKISKEVKKLLLAGYKSKERKTFAPIVFARGITTLINMAKISPDRLIVDLDYLGFDKIIEEVIIQSVPKVSISFESVGRKSPAHLASYHFIGKKTSHKKTTVIPFEGTIALLHTRPNPEDSQIAYGLFSPLYHKKDRLSTSWVKAEHLQPGMIIATITGWEPIRAIYKTGHKQTFDIEVENTHNFVGNNIVAHNTYINSATATGIALDIDANSLSSGSGLDISSTSTAGTGSGASYMLNIARSGANSNATHTAYGIASSVTNTGTTSVNVGGLFTATGAVTNRGLEVAAMTGATSTGLTIGALSGTTANTGINVGAISGALATGAGITVGNISTTGTTNYGVQLGTMTGGTTSNYQIQTGNITAIASATNAGLVIGTTKAVTGTAASSTNYGININPVDSTGTANYGLYVGAVSGATSNYSAIFAGGNVGIGDTTPAAALTVGDGDDFQVDSTGHVGVMTGTGSGIAIRTAGTYSFGGGAYGIYTEPTGDSGATTNLAAYYGRALGGTGTFTTTTMAGMYLDSNSKGASQTVTNNYGLLVASEAVTSTNNYGAYIGTISGGSTFNTGLRITGTAAASTNYAIYADSAAQNYFAGNIGIGDASPDGLLDLDSSATATNVFGITNTGIFTGTGTTSVAQITANSATSGDILTISSTALTSGSGIVYTGPSGGTAGVTDAALKISSDVGNIGTSNGLISSTATFDGTTATGVNLYLTSSDAIAAANTDYGIYNSVTNTGAIDSAITKTSYGSYTSVSSTLAAPTTAGTTNVYGQYITTTATHAGDFGTVNNYGLYVANGTSSTNGTSRKIGLYIEDLATTGPADNNYGICFDCDGTYSSSTAANGITWGSDANLVTLYRSASDTLKTDDALIVGGATTTANITVNGGTDSAVWINSTRDSYIQWQRSSVAKWTMYNDGFGGNTDNWYLASATMTGSPAVLVASQTGLVGIGTTYNVTPTATLQILTAAANTGFSLAGTAPTSVAGNGTSPATNTMLVVGTAGGASSGTTGQTGGTGGAISLTSGIGGAVAGASGIGGAGGGLTLAGGAGGNGAATGGAGGAISITAGNAGTGGNAAGGAISLTAGTGTGSGAPGSITLTSNVASGTTTTSGFVLDATAITTGTGLYLTTDSVTTGKLFDIATTGNTWTGNSTTSGLVNLASTSTAGTASDSDILLNIARSGANAQLAHTAYGLYSSVTNTNATSGTNIAGYFSATGATTANTAVSIGAISTAAATNTGLLLSTMTGGTTSNYQISTGILTSATTTTNAQLNLGGVVTTGGTTNYGINVGALSGTGTTNYGINVGASTATGTTNYGMKIGAISGAASGTNYGLYVDTVSGASTANYSAIFAGGNVGIGTATPGSLLEISKTAATGTNYSNQVLRLTQGMNSINTIYSRVAMYDDTIYGADIGLVFANTAGNQYNMVFSVNDDTTGNPVEAMRIIGGTSTGYVGIGDTTPDAKLDIDSTQTAGADFLITNTGIGLSGTVAGITSNSTTTGDILTISSTALTSGSGIVYTGPSGGTAGVTDAALKITSDVGNIGTSNGLISSTATFDGTTASGVNLYLTSSDAIAAANTDYGIYNSVTNTGAIDSAITKTSYGSYTSVSSTLAAPTTAGTTNVYGQYITTTATHAANFGTVNNYGLYIDNGTSSTNGNSTKYGIYVAAQSGADANQNYALYTAGGTVQFTCTTSATTWTTSQANPSCSDYAEVYDTDDLSMEAGDIIALNTVSDGKVGRSGSAYQKEIIGIYSTSPGMLIGPQGVISAAGDSSNLGFGKVPVALTGRVPVKVSTENGAIEKGDFLTSSSIPGVAMKATKPGQVVGKALEEFTGNSGQVTGKIMVFVNVSFADPGNFLASLSLDNEGNLITPKIKTDHLVISTNINMARSDNKGLIAYTQGTSTANQPTYNIDVVGSLKNLETAVVDVQDHTASTSAKLADVQSSVATSSAALADLKSQINSLAGQIATSSSTPRNDTAELNLTPPSAMTIATQSAVLADLKVTSEATFSAKLAAYDLSVSNEFKSLGSASLGNTIIAGSVTVDGLFSITGGNTIDAIGTLFLQKSPLATNIDMFAGKVLIDNTGKLTAQTVSAKEYQAVAGASVGTGVITSGAKSVEISSTIIKPTSRVFITPTKETTLTLSVTSQSDGKFTVSVPSDTTTDLTFNWWVVGEAN